METLFLLAVAAAALCVWGLLVAADWLSKTSHDTRFRGVEILLWTIGLAPALIGLLGTPAAELEGTLENQSAGFGALVGELANIAIVLLCLILLVTTFLSGNRTKMSPILIGGLLLSAAMLAASFFGTRPTLVRGIVIVPLCLITFATLPIPDHRWVIERLKRISLVYVYSALLLAVVWPEKVVSNEYPSILGLPQVRLLGLVFQGNVLGPIAAMAIFMVLRTPRNSLRWVHLSSSFVVLFFAQGKTAWAGTIFGLILMWAFAKGSPTHRNVRLLTASALFLFLAFQAFTPAAQERVASWSTASQDLTSLNGRTFVWDATIKVWEENRAFGYGPTIWSPEFRARYGESFAFAGQAHNQFIQSLGEAGLVGLAGLLLYVGGMLLAAVRTGETTAGLSLALFALMATRLMTEAGLRTFRVDAAFLLHVLLVYLLMAAWHERKAAVKEPAQAWDPPAESMGAEAYAGSVSIAPQ